MTTIDKLKTAGQIAYETDCEGRPYYGTGERRKTWAQLADYARWSWERNPTPRYDKRFTRAA